MAQKVDNYQFLCQEFDKKKSQYHHVEVQGVMVNDKGAWINAITKFCPKAGKETFNPFTYNYGEAIIFSRVLSCEEFLKVIEGLKNNAKVSLPELIEYGAPNIFIKERQHRYEFYASYEEQGGILFEWPSSLYYTEYSDGRYPRPQIDPILIVPNLPVFPSLDAAINKVAGIPGSSSYIGRVIVIIPNYSARMRLTICSKNQVIVNLDSKESLDRLLCKYYCYTTNGVLQGDLEFKEDRAQFNSPIELERGYFYLLSKEGELLDYRSLVFDYPSGAGIEIEYTPENIEVMIGGGENEKLEFKEDIPQDPKEFVETVVAFANKHGGIIIVGVDNKGRIVGIRSDEKTLIDRIPKIIRDYCDPFVEVDIKSYEARGSTVVLIFVPQGSNKPYLVKDRGPFIRVGATDRIMTRAELDECRPQQYPYYLYR